MIFILDVFLKYASIYTRRPIFKYDFRIFKYGHQIFEYRQDRRPQFLINHNYSFKIRLFTNLFLSLQSETRCSAVGSVLRSGRRGRQFEPGHLD